MKTTLLLAMLSLVLAGCNTIEGIGKDVRKMGEAVENAARK